MTRTVRFLDGNNLWPIARQSPAGDGIVNETRFYFGPGPEPTDWLVVLNSMPSGATQSSATERAIFLSGEPPIRGPFNSDFLHQFGHVAGVDTGIAHPNLLLMPPLIPWHVGVRTREPETYALAMSFADLARTPQKTKLCSCIASSLNDTSGHRLRFAFVKRLRAELGDRIDFFGRGVRSIADKEIGLAPYRYHIAIENSAVPHYWTEKLADPFLRNCFPIYAGAPNIHDYFDPESLCVIDIREPATAIERIAAILASDLDQRSAAAIEEAKRRVMQDYNMLNRLDRLLADLEADGSPTGLQQPIHPEGHFIAPGAPLPIHLRAHEGLANALRRLRARLGLDG